jgi:rhamnose utilization protein RhaD (predicted bifunctional aldolase and dehydrogenase)
LATLSADALMPLRIEPLLTLLDAGAAAPAVAGTDEIMRVALSARLDPADGRRPSVECLFHALLPEPIVLHTHPTVVNALTCARDGPRISDELFGDAVLWVPYVDPGLPLARRIADVRRAHRTRTGGDPPRALLLQNHGLIVSGDTAEEVAGGCERVVTAVRQRLAASGPSPLDDSPRAEQPDETWYADAERVVAPALGALLASGARPKVVTFDRSPEALDIATTSAGRELVAGGPLTPDQIVYTGSWPMWLEPPIAGERDSILEHLRERLAVHVATTGSNPSVIVAAGLGIFVAADSARFAETANETFLDAMRVARGAARLGGVRVLAPGERAFIETWEAEAYRRGVQAAAPASTTTP